MGQCQKHMHHAFTGPGSHANKVILKTRSLASSEELWASRLEAIYEQLYTLQTTNVYPSKSKYNMSCM